MTHERFVIPEAVATRAPRLGQAGVEWLASLPAIIAACAERWDLQIESPYGQLWYNYVAKARQGGEPVTLKICAPDHEFLEEMTALRLFDGNKCVRLIDSDLKLRALLLERAEPGDMVEVLRDNAAEISATAQVMLGLWRPAPAEHPFPLATDWLNAALELSKLPLVKSRHTWVQPALERAAEMQAERQEMMLLHGDLHHGNILSAQREPWLAIDPKGFVGDAAWDVAPFLFNSLKKDDPSERRKVIRKRADQFAEELLIDREWLYFTVVARSLQGAFWSLRDEEDETPNGSTAMLCAEELAKGV